MPKSPILKLLPLILSLCLSSAADAGSSPKGDVMKLKRSYEANDWHMKRFMSEYVSLEREFAASPKDPEYIKRTRALKMQIDLLTRENERILNSLDPAVPGDRQ